VALNGERRLKAVGKTLAAPLVDGESVGLIAFRGQGVAAFRAAIERAIRDPAALQKWYHDVINLMTDSLVVETELIKGLWWREIDTSEDLAEARAYLTAWGQGEDRRKSSCP
jgi:choline kinase